MTEVDVAEEAPPPTDADASEAGPELVADDDPRLRALTLRVAALEDPDHRSGRLAELLKAMAPEVIAAAIDRAARRCNDPDQRLLYLSLIHVLLTVRQRPALTAGPLRGDAERQWPAGPEIARLIGAASRGGQDFAAALLRATLSDPGPYDGRPLPPHVSIEHLPLGTRRQQARGPRREQLVRLLCDTDPAVVELLARNPRLRQDDLMQVATNRRTHPWALWALMLSPRWLANAPISAAVAHNPVCPEWLLLALAPLLPGPTLLDVLRKRPLLGPEFVEPLRALHRGALRATLDARLLATLAVPVAVAWEVDVTLAAASEGEDSEEQPELDEALALALLVAERSR